MIRNAKMNKHKRCPECKEIKHLSEFRKRKDGSIECYCRPCTSERNARYYIAHREKHLKHVSEYREINRDKIRERCAKRRVDNIDEFHKREAEYRKRGREKKRESKARWQRENPEKVAASNHKRRATVAGNGGSFTDQEWIYLKEKYYNCCVCCGRGDIKLQADHVLPLAMGGTSDISNIQPLCKICNCKKHAKYIDYRPI